MIELSGSGNGVLLGVQVSPGASRSRVLGEHGGRLKLSVAAAPERGKANEAVVELLAEELGVRKSQIAVVRGETSKQKTVLIGGVTVEEIRERVSKLM
jgi:uncharacterized protein